MSPRHVAAREHARRGIARTWSTSPGECSHTCPAGNPCACTGQPHAWHICTDPACWCHTSLRYDLLLNGKEVS